MILNDVAVLRSEFDSVERKLAGERREKLLRRLGTKAEGLRVWAFGAGWETRTLAEVSTERISEFAAKYA